MLTKPTLAGARVTLRPLAANDLDAYWALLQDAESLRLTGTQASFSREQIAGWLASVGEHDDRIDLAIVLRDTNELIG
ncbi:MAG: GNAT family N-acetyltransferase, partial [Roseiflexaceae bacterium]|nr:GNAT family N-acetyltransferase [Roseiflexaceae bacterium]